MEEIINSIVGSVTSVMSTMGPLSGFILIIVESMLPVLPLAVFVALNVLTFGNVLGFIISWIATIIGCTLMFLICRNLQNIFLRKFKNNGKVNSFRKKVSNISFTSLVIILAIPFTPASAINIGAGLSDISTKKYVFALIIGKLPMIYFWGFIGKSLIESFSDISVIAEIVFMLLFAFLVSKLANKFLKL